MELAKSRKKEPYKPKEPPAHFTEARNYYRDVLRKDPEWMRQYDRQYVAIVGTEVVDFAPDFETLSTRDNKI